MDETLADNRLYNHYSILQPIVQGCRETSQDWQEEGRAKGAYGHPCNEGVPSDIRFTSAATNDSFMLKPSSLSKGDIVAMDRAYIDYEKFEQLTNNQVIYVTKMKKSLKYEILSDTIYQAPEGVMEVRVQEVKFTKKKQDGETITHYARIITYVDVKKHKLVSLLTNDKGFDPSEIIEIYRQRWEIELLFKQIKQNFPLRYFYGESANAIKIQIWVTLIANLLLMVMQKQLKRPWSFSGLATMVRITLMNYVDFYSLFNFPEKDWEDLLAKMGQGHMESQLLFE